MFQQDALNFGRQCSGYQSGGLDAAGCFVAGRTRRHISSCLGWRICPCGARINIGADDSPCSPALGRTDDGARGSARRLQASFCHVCVCHAGVRARCADLPDRLVRRARIDKQRRV
jgi:hypothetical protein